MPTALDPTLCGDFQSGSVSIDKETTPPPFHKGNELFYVLKSLYYNEVNNKIIMQLAWESHSSQPCAFPNSVVFHELLLESPSEAWHWVVSSHYQFRLYALSLAPHRRQMVCYSWNQKDNYFISSCEACVLLPAFCSSFSPNVTLSWSPS